MVLSLTVFTSVFGVAMWCLVMAKAIEAEIFLFDKINTFLVKYNFVTFGGWMHFWFAKYIRFLNWRVVRLGVALVLVPVWNDVAVIMVFWSNDSGLMERPDSSTLISFGTPYFKSLSVHSRLPCSWARFFCISISNFARIMGMSNAPYNSSDLPNAANPRIWPSIVS